MYREVTSSVFIEAIAEIKMYREVTSSVFIEALAMIKIACAEPVEAYREVIL